MCAAVSSLLDRRYRISQGIALSHSVRCFAGVHAELDMPVRIYVMPLPADAASLPDGGESLLRERVRESLALRSTSIARVRDCFRAGQQVCVVTEEIDGEPLARRINRASRLSLRQTLSLGLQLCDALSQISRTAPSLLSTLSITPANVVQTPDGDAVLADLGVERWLEGASPALTPETLPYLAPEDVMDGRSGLSSHIYGLAAVMYAALAGEPPAPFSVGRLPVEQLEPLVPHSVSNVLERALQIDPASRFSSADEFGEALGIAIDGLLPLLTHARRTYVEQTGSASQIATSNTTVSSPLRAAPTRSHLFARAISREMHRVLHPATLRQQQV